MATVWELMDGIVAAVAASPEDFRTRESLIRELDADPRAFDAAAEQLVIDGVLRHPHVRDPRSGDWFRLVSAGTTRQEWWNRLLELVRRDGTKVASPNR